MRASLNGSSGARHLAESFEECIALQISGKSFLGVYHDTAGGNTGAMGTMKALWASVQGNPVFMRRVNGWLTVFWVAMIPVSMVTGWISSVTYVAVLSLWALVSGHWAAWQAARVEVTQQAEMDERMADPIEQRVVDVLVESTNIEPAASR